MQKLMQIKRTKVIISHLLFKMSMMKQGSFQVSLWDLKVNHYARQEALELQRQFTQTIYQLMRNDSDSIKIQSKCIFFFLHTFAVMIMNIIAYLNIITGVARYFFQEPLSYPFTAIQDHSWINHLCSSTWLNCLPMQPNVAQLHFACLNNVELHAV